MIIRVFAVLARVVLGAVFIFSGITKGIDPLGTTYKFIDYFHAFHLNFMEPYALPLAIIQNGLEFIIGLSLLSTIWIRITSRVSLIVMSFFTILTLVIAIYNPVSDCGCFGDAIKLSNWHTFYKNIILFTLAIFVFIFRNNYLSPMNKKGQATMTFTGILLFIGFSWYSLVHLPVIDFMPFKVGNHIPSQMQVKEGAPRDSFLTLLVYEKEGIKKEFTLQDFPWQDSTWKWVETKNKLISEGEKPPVHDFSITSPDSIDITDEILSDTNFVFIATVPNIEKANREGLLKIDSLARFCKETKNCRFIALSGSGKEEIKKVRDELKLSYQFCFTDATPLKTVVRSSPGLIVIREGTVLAKWAYSDIPSFKDSKEISLSQFLSIHRAKNDRLIIVTLSLTILLMIMLHLRSFKRK